MFLIVGLMVGGGLLHEAAVSAPTADGLLWRGGRSVQPLVRLLRGSGSSAGTDRRARQDDGPELLERVRFNDGMWCSIVLLTSRLNLGTSISSYQLPGREQEKRFTKSTVRVLCSLTF